MRHFTIVSYTFPPSNGIGGRRWAKFSQQLLKKGYEVTIVCADNNAGDKNWYKNEYTGAEVLVLPKCYPDWLTGLTKNIFEKLLYFFYTKIISRFTKKNLFDRGYAWEETLLTALEDIHRKKKIDILVVTGAPFSLLYYGAKFKKKHKSVFYVSDFRDPWSWGYCYGIPDLSKSKKEFQLISEFETIRESDMICAPTQHMIDVLKDKYSAFASKLYLLPHAFDPEKFSSINKNEPRKGFVYGGTLYKGIDEYLKTLSKILKSNQNSGFKWDIYTGANYPLINHEFEEGLVYLHSFVPEEQLFSIISKSSAYLAFFPIADKDLVSTKFFEIIYTETPILYIGEEGEVGKFIKNNRVGVHILPENMESELPQYLSGKIPFEKGYFDVGQYSFSVVTDNFLKALGNYRN